MHVTVYTYIYTVSKSYNSLRARVYIRVAYIIIVSRLNILRMCMHGVPLKRQLLITDASNYVRSVIAKVHQRFPRTLRLTVDS